MSSTVSALTASRLTPYGISDRLVGLALPACLARSTDAIDSTNAIEAPRYKRNERNQRNRPNSLASLAFPARRASLADPIDSTDSTRLTGLDHSTDDEVDPLRKPRRLQKARELTKEVYRLTADHQFSRDFGLRNQMRRVVVPNRPNRLYDSMNSRPMKVVLLVGGLGTRLSEETDARPKPMVEIGGRPILWRIMKIYSAHGIHEFIICLGYKGYMIKEYFANYFLQWRCTRITPSPGG